MELPWCAPTRDVALGKTLVWRLAGGTLLAFESRALCVGPWRPLCGRLRGAAQGRGGGVGARPRGTCSGRRGARYQILSQEQARLAYMEKRRWETAAQANAARFNESAIEIVVEFIKSLGSTTKRSYIETYLKKLGVVRMMDALANKYGHSPADAVIDLFGIFDTNKDGILDAQEIDAMINSNAMIGTNGPVHRIIAARRAVACSDGDISLDALKTVLADCGSGRCVNGEVGLALLEGLSPAKAAALQSMECCEIGNMQRARFAAVFGQPRRYASLTRLDLRHSSIGDEGVAALVIGCPVLTSLDLSNNSIGVKGAVALAKGCLALELLYLSGNSIGTKGAVALAKSCPALRELNVSGNSLGPKGETALNQRLHNQVAGMQGPVFVTGLPVC